MYSALNVSPSKCPTIDPTSRKSKSGSVDKTEGNSR